MNVISLHVIRLHVFHSGNPARLTNPYQSDFVCISIFGKKAKITLLQWINFLYAQIEDAIES